MSADSVRQENVFFRGEERRVRCRVAVLGHSMVRDLPLSTGRPRNLEREDIILTRKFFVPGATVASIQEGEVWRRFVAFKPDLTFIWIGGNDIRIGCSPLEIGVSISRLGKRVERETGGKIGY